ncbi:MAG: glycosyltransferase, partial [Oscillibacter sp.]|nr:glycosyltransferase [Oscillibacter sp.]
MEREKPLISVIVPIYNVEACMERCLDSILAQTYPS